MRFRWTYPRRARPHRLPSSHTKAWTGRNRSEGARAQPRRWRRKGEAVRAWGSPASAGPCECVPVMAREGRGLAAPRAARAPGDVIIRKRPTNAMMVSISCTPDVNILHFNYIAQVLALARALQVCHASAGPTDGSRLFVFIVGTVKHGAMSERCPMLGY